MDFRFHKISELFVLMASWSWHLCLVALWKTLVASMHLTCLLCVPITWNNGIDTNGYMFRLLFSHWRYIELKSLHFCCVKTCGSTFIQAFWSASFQQDNVRSRDSDIVWTLFDTENVLQTPWQPVQSLTNTIGLLNGYAVISHSPKSLHYGQSLLSASYWS